MPALRFCERVIVHSSPNPSKPSLAIGLVVAGRPQPCVLLYSISTGEQLARWFGYRPEVSSNGQRLCLANGRGHLLVYDLQSLKQIDDLYFCRGFRACCFAQLFRRWKETLQF